MIACIRCHGAKFDNAFKVRNVKQEAPKLNVTEGEAPRRADLPSQAVIACAWCSSATATGQCGDCGFTICQPCFNQQNNPPVGPGQAAPRDQTGNGGQG